MCGVIERRSYNRRDLDASKDLMNARRIRIAASFVVPALILLLPIAVYLADRTANSGEIPRNVSVEGLDVGGLSRDDAISVVRAYEADLKSEKAVFVVSGSTYELDPTSVCLAADVGGAVEVAMNQRTGGVISGVAAQIARGCTSGQALTGGALLNLGSWTFMLCVFAGGYAVSYFMRRAWQ